MRISLCVVAVAVFLFPAVCLACLWDTDTLEQERQQFPDTRELIVGDFVRHSKAYYRWRIEDRQKKPLDQRTPMDYDDIAVAYDKLGQQDQAIETIQKKIERFPNESVYQSQANLGTFLIHAGKLEEGLTHIEQAIEINPDAHFGREVYQKLLVEYVLEQRAKGNEGLPLASDTIHDFQRFLAGKLNWPSGGKFDAREDERKVEARKAIKGILGMMRFGHYDSPILLEALGDVLRAQEFNANMLAAQAYLRAASVVDDEDAAAAYREKARRALLSQVGEKVDSLQADLDTSVAEAAEKFAQIEADEAAWAAAGKNLDEEFAKKYYPKPAEPAATEAETSDP